MRSRIFRDVVNCI